MIYNKGKTIFKDDTHKLIFQSDGNLVLYHEKGGGVKFASNTEGSGHTAEFTGNKLNVMDSNNKVLFTKTVDGEYNPDKSYTIVVNSDSKLMLKESSSGTGSGSPMGSMSDTNKGLVVGMLLGMGVSTFFLNK